MFDDKSNNNPYYRKGTTLGQPSYDTKSIDPTSMAGEGCLSGIKDGVKLGCGIGIPVVFLAGLALMQLHQAGQGLSKTQKELSDYALVEMKKDRLLIKGEVLQTLSNAGSYNVDDSGTITLSEGAKNRINETLKPLNDFPGVLNKPEYKTLHMVFLSPDSNQTDNRSFFNNGYELFKQSYRSDWKDSSKLLLKLGELSDIPTPGSYPGFPFKSEN